MLSFMCHLSHVCLWKLRYQTRGWWACQPGKPPTPHPPTRTSVCNVTVPISRMHLFAQIELHPSSRWSGTTGNMVCCCAAFTSCCAVVIFCPEARPSGRENAHDAKSSFFPLPLFLLPAVHLSCAYCYLVNVSAREYLLHYVCILMPQASYIWTMLASIFLEGIKIEKEEKGERKGERRKERLEDICRRA